MATKVSVFTQRPALLRLLRERCPDFRFVEGDGGVDASIAVVDDDSLDVLASLGAHVVTRVVLSDEPPAAADSRAIVVPSASLRSAPETLMSIVSRLAKSERRTAELRERVEYLEHLRELTELSDADDASAAITKHILSILGLSHGTMLLHDSKVERYVVSFSNDPQHRDTGDFVSGIDPALLQHALSIHDACSLELSSDGRQVLLVPIELEEDMIGVVKVPVPDGVTVAEEKLREIGRYMGAVTPIVANVYQLSRSRDLAMRDDLTKAFNRRFFDGYLEEEIERSRRYGTIFSIIFLDLDDLKSVNNRHGHLIGSRTLQEVAKRILSAVRGIDKVVRFGGDEFCIILPQTDDEQAKAVGSRVRAAIAGSPFRLEPTIEVRITASFGIATYPLHALSKDELIRRADAAMYHVKATTKDAIGVAAPESSHPV